MNELSNLRRVPGSTKTNNRRGRGYGSGNGLTGGRGTKGYGSRSGSGVRPGFEGGQMPLQRVLRKFGFHSRNHKDFSIVNIEQLNRFNDGAVIDIPMMLETRLVSKLGYGIKILGKGDLKVKLTVIAHEFSKSALKKIEGAGGKAVRVIEQEV